MNAFDKATRIHDKISWDDFLRANGTEECFVFEVNGKDTFFSIPSFPDEHKWIACMDGYARLGSIQCKVCEQIIGLHYDSYIGSINPWRMAWSCSALVRPKPPYIKFVVYSCNEFKMFEALE